MRYSRPFPQVKIELFKSPEDINLNKPFSSFEGEGTPKTFSYYQETARWLKKHFGFVSMYLNGVEIKL